MIDRNDFIIKRNRKFFRIWCPYCGKDKGYKNPESENKPCYSCNGKKANKASIIVRSGKLCSKDGCNRKHFGLGLCSFHYEKQRRPAKGKSNKHCAVCNTLFVGSAKQKYCSNKCNLKNYRIQNVKKIKTTRLSEKFKEKRSEWKQKNILKIRIKNREYRKNQYKNNLNYRLASNLRSRLSRCIKNKTMNFSAVTDLGCSIEELKEYLESKFQPGMTWENYGKWHIDHIIPLASFDLSDLNSLKKASHYTNLQPLWAFDNISKGNRL